MTTSLQRADSVVAVWWLCGYVVLVPLGGIGKEV